MELGLKVHCDRLLDCHCIYAWKGRKCKLNWEDVLLEPVKDNDPQQLYIGSLHYRSLHHVGSLHLTLLSIYYKIYI